jgi:hypothetical protein
MTWSMAVLVYGWITRLLMLIQLWHWTMNKMCHCIMNTVGKWIWKVYCYLFIYLFIQFPLFSGEQVCRNLHFWSPFRKLICTSKRCSSMSAPVCFSAHGVWICLSYTSKILTIEKFGTCSFLTLVMVGLLLWLWYSLNKSYIGILRGFEWCCW